MGELDGRRAPELATGGRFNVQRVAGRGWGIELQDAKGRIVLARPGFASADLALAEVERITKAAGSARVFMLAGVRQARPGE